MAKKLLVAAGLVAVVVLSNAGLTLADGVSERALGDRPDDVSGLQQVHLLYVLASDGEDRALDTDGTLVASAASAQAWLSAQTGGRTFRVDRFGGAPDITFVRLSQSQADLTAHGLFLREELERRLVARGFTDPLKMYAVYYDGAADGACGGAFYPPSIPGSVVALYLRGLPGPGFVPCADKTFRGATEPPDYWEFALLHEIVHGLGHVPACAPHHHLAGHTTDSPTDLMYAGQEPWTPSVLDVGRDDYFGHGRPGCLDLAASGLLESPLPPPTDEPPVPPEPLPGEGPPIEGGPAEPVPRCRVPQVRGLTVRSATSRLKRAGCSLGRVRRIHRPPLACRGAFKVVRQRPRAQSIRAPGTRVHLALRRPACRRASEDLGTR